MHIIQRHNGIRILLEFHLGLQCLLKYPFLRVPSTQRIKQFAYHSFRDFIRLMHSFEVNIRICQPENVKPRWTSLSRFDKS